MSNTNYEIELKVLLWNTFPPNTFINALRKDFESVVELWEQTQRNHYFEIPHRSQIIPAFEERLPIDQENKFLISNFRNGKDIVIRTREINEPNTKTQVLLVMKSTIDSWTSQNGTIRKELEIEVPMTIEDLDSTLIAWAEIKPQAKWSRTRKTFEVISKDWFKFTVCLDKNAWYGYLAEFEVVVQDSSKIQETKKNLLDCITHMWLQELPWDQLQRMFEFYNKNWETFYQTQNYFFIK